MKRLRGSSLYITIPERYAIKYAGEYKTEGGVILVGDNWDNYSVPYEIGTVTYVGDGFDKFQRPLETIYAIGDKVKILPKKGRDQKIDGEWAFTWVMDSDVIEIL